MNCRGCGRPLEHVLIDLGTAPPSNAYITADRLRAAEVFLPLRVLVCDACWLVQTDDYAGAGELFDADYAYFSSVSSSWLEHCRRYASAVVDRFDLTASSRVVEVAANDGYLLQFFAERSIPCYGIEPTASTAAAARAKGIEIVEAFFGAALGRELAAAGRTADLMAANNVLAHVPDPNDFVRGFAELLAPGGVATFEFPHLRRLVDEGQFDTIYHEHFSYLSLGTVTDLFARNGLTVFDVEELPTHGGSLRVFAHRADGDPRPVRPQVAALLDSELAAGMRTLDYYRGFQERADRIKDAFVRYLLDARRDGLRVAAYGAAAKGNTLVNFAGVRRDLVEFVVDRSPGKQGKFLPGSRIPIVGEDVLRERRPDRVIIFPWNIAAEVVESVGYVREWGARFVRAFPEIEEL